MKRTLLCLAMIAAVVSFASAQEARVSFQLTGGLNYAAGGDFARGLNGQTEYLTNEFGAEGELSSPIWGFQFAGEFLYHFNDRFALGLGVGYFEHMKQTQATYENWILEIDETVTPKYKVIPLTANLHYSFPWFGSIRLDLYAGAGFYLTSLDYNYRQDVGVLGFNGSAIYQYNASKGGFGVQGGMNLEWVIDPKFSILLGVQGRIASVSGFTGEWTEIGTGDIGWDYHDSGTSNQVWYLQWDSGVQKYGQLWFQDDEPEGSDVSEVRPARLGLSGFTATLGFKIKLF